MITNDNKEAIRERLAAGLADLEKRLGDTEKEYMRSSVLEAIDKSKAILQELDANAAMGTATLGDLELAAEERKVAMQSNLHLMAHRDNLERMFERMFERGTVAAEKQADAFDRIATLLVAEAAKG